MKMHALVINESIPEAMQMAGLESLRARSRPWLLSAISTPPRCAQYAFLEETRLCTAILGCCNITGQVKKVSASQIDHEIIFSAGLQASKKQCPHAMKFCERLAMCSSVLQKVQDFLRKILLVPSASTTDFSWDLGLYCYEHMSKSVKAFCGFCFCFLCFFCFGFGPASRRSFRGREALWGSGFFFVFCVFFGFGPGLASGAPY